MVDHHVDRPGVEAWQHVKLTGTNSSIGFIALIINVQPYGKRPTVTTGSTRASRLQAATIQRPNLSFAGLVAMAGRQAPDPIPNSAVKLPSANGTSSQDAGE